MTGDSATSNDRLVYEKAVNDDYVKRSLAETGRRGEELGALLKGTGGLKVGPLLGRVERHGDPDDPYCDFYVGERSLPDFATPVVSWKADAAKVFFEPDFSKSPLASGVLARRTLVTRADRVIAVHDDVDSAAPAGHQAFRPAVSMSIPLPPKRAAQRAAASPAAAVINPTASPSPAGAPTQIPQQPANFERSTLEPDPKKYTGGRRRDNTSRSMRAREALVASISAPRGKRLSSVLSTLQPDQFELVSLPKTEPLIVQGHPGTGKTVVAAYRAMYLTDVERGSDKVQRLLVLGPTTGYVKHVQDIIHGEHGSGRIKVQSLDPWLLDVAGWTHAVTKRAGLTSHMDASPALWPLVQEVVRRLGRSMPSDGPAPSEANFKNVFEGLKKLGGRGDLVAQPDMVAWCQALPRWNDAKVQHRFGPMVAAIGLAIRPVKARSRFDHMVVDEAQDVRPLEWALLDTLNRGKTWTLLGDTNQRRSDWSYPDWASLALDISLVAPGEAWRPRLMFRGYRSTKQIMSYANSLLPRDERDVDSLQQDGIAVTVLKQADVPGAAVTQAARLAEQHSRGTVAIISPRTTIISAALQRAGFHGLGKGEWTNDASTITLLDPDSARGLEFDGVVVEEPGLFPLNVGRHGVLYTSLTRANRQLVVVHSRALPGGLRNALRSPASQS